MNKMINNAIEKKASDIHIYPHIFGESYIRFRVSGTLENIEKISNEQISSLISLLKFNSNIDISRNKEPQSGKFVYDYENKKYYLRVSTLPLTELTEGCVVRIFSNEIDDVNYSIFREDCSFIEGLSKYTNGLVLFSGPTGSGKSTSLYKLANLIANQNKQVLSIEDPIEKNIPSLIQMQINEKAGITYTNAIKSVLRCDPDVIIIGEIRDSATAKQVISSALSGHLVLSTVHAEDGIGIINRLKDLGVSEEDIRQTVLCLISQRLVNVNFEKRGLITEIFTKQNIKNYYNNVNFSFSTLKDKFNIAFELGLINEDEKARWGF